MASCSSRGEKGAIEAREENAGNEERGEKEEIEEIEIGTETKTKYVLLLNFILFYL